MRANVVDSTHLDWEDDGHGPDYQVRRRYLARAVGLQQLGCSMYEVPPGKRDWPLHWHHANEEAIYVLEGNGTLRFPDKSIPLRPGMFAGLGRTSEDARQIINDSDQPLRFLCISGMVAPDVTEYPEEGKMGVFCGGAPGTLDEARTVNEVHRRSAAVDYWA